MLEPPPIVGRDAELDRLMRLLGAAEGGDPQVAVIHGPPGIGKTRLAEEVVERARRRGARIGVGRCCQEGEAPPFWPWRAILHDIGAPESLLEEGPGPGQGRFARFLAVLQHLRSGAADGPAVVVVDDAHLADPASLLLVRFLARERGLALLLLLTCRDRAPETTSEVAGLLSELEEAALEVPLTGLSEEAVGAYLAAFRAPASDPDLLHAVAAVTKGNPLHLRSITVQSDLGAGGVSGGLERAIRRVLERLPDADRRLIALVALLGPDVSAHEAARMGEVSPAIAAETLAQSVDLGLVVPCGTDRFRFVHEMIRSAATASLAVSDRLAAHARAAALLAGDEPERAARRAHHALAAATRSAEDAQRAVEIARAAARTLKRADGYEGAAVLLRQAAEIHAAARLPGPTAELTIERAECVLASGLLAEARPLFEHGARLAEKEANPVALARAALGLGGVWVGEHRLTYDAERMLALQRRALEALPAGEPVLRARLAMRLAAEEAYRGGSVSSVLAAVEEVRRTGDAHALAEALSLAHHALLTPEHTWRRTAITKELIAQAAAAEDGLLSLVGQCWQAADLFLLGDPAARAALVELRVRADALRCRSVLFIVEATEVMLLIRAGEFEKAEEAAARCCALGTEVGDADAQGYRGGHLAAIRAFQGREVELADLAASIAASPTLIRERDQAFASAAALFALRGGREQPARAMLDRLAREGLGSIPSSSSWLLTMLAVTEMAHALHDERIAKAAYDTLLPYADLPVMASLAVVCFGSVHRPLGLAALTCGKLDLAIEHFAAAVAANESLAHRPAAIQAQAELGLARLRRAGRRDDARGRALLQDACAAAEAAGMGGLVARWRETAEGAGFANGPDEPGAALMTPTDGKRWRVVLGGEVAFARDRVGVRYLAQLVTAPDRGIPVLALVAQGGAEHVEHVREPMMDGQTMTAVRGRIRDLRARSELSEQEQDELAALTRELARALGLGGRPRSFADAPERARTAVRKAIKRAIDEISADNPAIGQHLAQRIETGAVCCYRLETVSAT